MDDSVISPVFGCAGCSICSKKFENYLRWRLPMVDRSMACLASLAQTLHVLLRTHSEPNRHQCLFGSAKSPKRPVLRELATQLTENRLEVSAIADLLSIFAINPTLVNETSQRLLQDTIDAADYQDVDFPMATVLSLLTVAGKPSTDPSPQAMADSTTVNPAPERTKDPLEAVKATTPVVDRHSAQSSIAVLVESKTVKPSSPNVPLLDYRPLLSHCRNLPNTEAHTAIAEHRRQMDAKEKSGDTKDAPSSTPLWFRRPTPAPAPKVPRHLPVPEQLPGKDGAVHTRVDESPSTSSKSMYKAYNKYPATHTPEESPVSAPAPVPTRSIASGSTSGDVLLSSPVESNEVHQTHKDPPCASPAPAPQCQAIPNAPEHSSAPPLPVPALEVPRRSGAPDTFDAPGPPQASPNDAHTIELPVRGDEEDIFESIVMQPLGRVDEDYESMASQVLQDIETVTRQCQAIDPRLIMTSNDNNVSILNHLRTIDTVAPEVPRQLPVPAKAPRRSGAPDFSSDNESMDSNDDSDSEDSSYESEEECVDSGVIDMSSVGGMLGAHINQSRMAHPNAYVAGKGPMKHPTAPTANVAGKVLRPPTHVPRKYTRRTNSERSDTKKSEKHQKAKEEIERKIERNQQWTMEDVDQELVDEIKEPQAFFIVKFARHCDQQSILHRRPVEITSELALSIANTNAASDFMLNDVRAAQRVLQDACAIKLFHCFRRGGRRLFFRRTNLPLYKELQAIADNYKGRNPKSTSRGQKERKRHAIAKQDSKNKRVCSSAPPKGQRSIQDSFK